MDLHMESARKEDLVIREDAQRGVEEESGKSADLIVKREAENVELTQSGGGDSRGRAGEGKGLGCEEFELEVKIEKTGAQRLAEERKSKTTGEGKVGKSNFTDVKSGRAGDKQTKKSKRDEVKAIQVNPGRELGEGSDVLKTNTEILTREDMDVSDFLTLLRLLQIYLPPGVLSTEVIMLSNNDYIVTDALTIVQELEGFTLKFRSRPRLICSKVKHALALGDSRELLQITKLIFFKSTNGSVDSLKKQWKENSSNTGRGFRLKDRYKAMGISLPAMYATAKTRSWKNLDGGRDVAKITKGRNVSIPDLKSRKYKEESTLCDKTSHQGRFGKFHHNSEDEMECLKFLYEEEVIFQIERFLTCSQGNKVDFGFLTGELDFLVHIYDKESPGEAATKQKKERVVIECKGTTGDMVGKVFTKPQNESRLARLKEAHEYCYQTQAYMYILNKEADTSESSCCDTAVMVIRHYHDDASNPQDFYWNYLKLDPTIQQRLDELKLYCQKDVLGCFLAVLKLIFQKEKKDD